MRLLGREQPLGERLDAGGAGALADADGEDARGEHEHVAALEPRVALRIAAVQQRRAREARVVGVDRAGDRGLAPAGGHRQRRDRHAVAQPHARVAREEQVGQRAHDEVLRRRHLLDEPAGDRELLAREPGHEHLGELRRGQRREPLAEQPGERRPDPLRLERRRERLLPGRVDRERLLEQLAQVDDLDAARAQRLREGVVLELGARDPRHPVEEQLVVVARREAPQLAAGAVQHDRRERPDLAGHAVREHAPILSCRRPRMPIGEKPDRIQYI